MQERWARLRRSLWQPPRPHGEQPRERVVGPLELFYDLAVVVLVGEAGLSCSGMLLAWPRSPRAAVNDWPTRPGSIITDRGASSSSCSARPQVVSQIVSRSAPTPGRSRRASSSSATCSAARFSSR